MSSPAALSSATVLFTDLVDSTATRAALGEERADELRQAHDRLLAVAVTAEGGTVVKSTGDGVLATFPSAAAGLAAAVAIQQAADRYCRSPRALAPIALRVGLSVGDVLFEDGDCHGMPVVEAARLMSVAAGGEIVCSELVRLLARGRGGHVFGSRGELALKGIDGLVAACDVAWTPLPDSTEAQAVPLPVALASADALPFVSRIDEFARLNKLLARDAGDGLAIAWVGGPPGIGKTRLAAEVARYCHDAGGLVLYGRCDRDRDVPFQAFIEALRTFVASLDGDAADALGPGAAELARLAPELAERDARLVPPPSVTPELDQYRLCSALFGWLTTQRALRPVLLVVDDVHWADRRTLDALNHLVRDPSPNGALVVATMRTTSPDVPDELTALVDELQRTGRSHRLALGGLDVTDVGALLTAGNVLPEGANTRAAAARLHELSGGNPLFLGSLLDAVRESRGDDIELPADVHAAVRSRVSRLPAELAALLAVGALVGLEFDLPVVAAAGGIDEDTALDLLELAERASLVEEVALDRYRFVHAVVPETLQSGLGAGRRARLHLRIAEAIDVHGDPADVSTVAALALHYRAGARDEASIVRAVDAARVAAHRSADLFDHRGALAHLDAALELLDRITRPVPALVAAVRAERGTALRRIGHTREALVALASAVDEAAASGDGALAVDAAVAYEITAWPSGTGGALPLLERVLALDDVDERRRVLALAALARQLEFVGRSDEAVRVGEDALLRAERFDDPSVVGHAAFALAFAMRSPDRLAECEALEARAELLFTASGEEEMRVSALAHRCNTLRRLGRGDLERERRDEVVAGFRRMRQPYFDYVATNHDYLGAFARSDLDRCAQLADEALELGGRLLGEDPSGLHGLRTFLLRRERGELARIGPLLARVLQQQPADEVWKPGLLALFVAIGDLDRARSVLDELAEDGFGGVPLDALREGCLGFLAEACLALGDATRARLLEPLLAPYRSVTLTLGFFAGDLGAGARSLAMLARATGDTGRAVALTREALIFHRDGLGSALWTAHTMVDLAELTGDERARQEATELARAHRLAGVLTRCDAAGRP